MFVYTEWFMFINSFLLHLLFNHNQEVNKSHKVTALPQLVIFNDRLMRDHYILLALGFGAFQ